jgi:hypothetical protein
VVKNQHCCKQNHRKGRKNIIIINNRKNKYKGKSLETREKKMLFKEKKQTFKMKKHNNIKKGKITKKNLKSKIRK